MSNLKKEFRRLLAPNLRLNIEKRQLFKKELRYLGHMVILDRIETDPDRTSAIKMYSIFPKSLNTNYNP